MTNRTSVELTKLLLVACDQSYFNAIIGDRPRFLSWDKSTCASRGASSGKNSGLPLLTICCRRCRRLSTRPVGNGKLEMGSNKNGTIKGADFIRFGGGGD